MNDRSTRGRPARPRRPHLAGAIGALALTLTLALAACAGGGDRTGGVASLSGSDRPTATTTSNAAGGSGTDRRQAALEFARCMRQHGIDMPDPRFDADGNMTLTIRGRPGSPKPDDPAFKAAQQACQKYLPNGGKPTRPNPQQLQQALQFARCMRAHGVDMPDPQPDGAMIVRGSGGGKSAGKGDNPDDPTFKRANQACKHFLGGKGGTVTRSGGDQ